MLCLLDRCLHNTSWPSKIYGLIFRLEINTYYFILLHTKSTGNKWKLDYLEGSICESHAKNRTQIGHFLWILERFSDEIWRNLHHSTHPTWRPMCTTSRILSHRRSKISFFIKFWEGPKIHEKCPIWVRFFACDSIIDPPTRSSWQTKLSYSSYKVWAL